MSETSFKGIAASEGTASGPAFCHQPLKLELPVRKPESSERELERFHSACQQADRELQLLKADVEARSDAATAAIFDAHRMMVADPMLLDSGAGAA